MIRVMLDLETLDTGGDATILSIGAVQFNHLMEPAIRSEFYVAVKPDQRAWGRTISGETVKWWVGQDRAAQAVFTDEAAVQLPEALSQFSQWYGSVAMEMWGNGADFDNVILGSAYEACHIKRPWSYSLNRCFRTLKNLGIPLGAGEGIARMGTHHNALDDAKYQAHYAVAYLRRLGR